MTDIIQKEQKFTMIYFTMVYEPFSEEISKAPPPLAYQNLENFLTPLLIETPPPPSIWKVRVVSNVAESPVIPTKAKKAFQMLMQSVRASAGESCPIRFERPSN